MTYKVLDIPSQEVFRNIYMGFVTGGNAAGEKRKAYGSAGAVARLERRIKVKMRELSDEVKDVPAGQMNRVLKAPPQALRLSADEFKMLTEYLNCVEWLTSGAEEVADMFDVIDAARTEESRD